MRAALLALALLAGCAAAPTAEDLTGGVVGFDPADPGIAGAVQAATATLPLFYRYALSGGQSLPPASIKVAFPTGPGRGDEVIWVSPFRMEADGSFIGLLANQPVAMPQGFGDPVEFDSSMVRDWAWEENDRTYGNYTARATIASGVLTREQIPGLSADPLPRSWQ
ncbi:DUF2314 domain-containing protein [Wenxinia saemankumensis]|uniref:Uncharacterized conserved protein YegJ, DUF2314 family n=1 Tax=Wenxinia saemankumensis TaxID=1447782 RepID=A0A1M6GSA2_9RHOB|nr:DUF2314 domain-containing protein [Wenxinia saemankumensis]SHJ12736.1 Uncharacterized conserved protein YegJ, DUF2314 family [Wenxinia saemankumensis]